MRLQRFKINALLSCTILLFVFHTMGCGGGSSSSSGGSSLATSVTVSGTVTFDFVPADKVSGLLYTNISKHPARGILVEAISVSDSSVLTSTSTSDAGGYSVSVPINTTIKIRVKAQMLKTDSPSWDFQVVDNTNSKALYTMDSAPFDIGGVNISGKDLNASSGWGGTGYTATRAAAPFSILDTVFKAVEKVKSASLTVTMPQLLINWSINNRPTEGNPSVGEIDTSYYDPTENQLYILGKENVDTDEFDHHVVAHEWGHYFEANFSRSDSLGNDHGPGEKLDPRAAFSEGFCNAFSGMAINDPNYVDTKGAMQGTIGVYMNLSDINGDPASIGWFSEDSVQYILYALYRSNMGFNPIYDVLVNGQKTASSFTTIYSFISFLKANNPAYLTTINNLLAAKNITTTAIDEWDSTATEANNGGNANTLPVYHKLIAGAAPFQICVDDEFGIPNKLKNRSFIHFDIASNGNYTIHADVVTAGGVPNIRLTSKGQDVNSTNNSTSGPASLTETLTPGVYVGEVYDYRHLSTNHTSVTGEVCFNVQFY